MSRIVVVILMYHPDKSIGQKYLLPKVECRSVWKNNSQETVCSWGEEISDQLRVSHNEDFIVYAANLILLK
jgi:hypothetical protein